MAKKNVNPPILKSEEKYATPKGVAIYPWLFKEDEVQEAYSMILAVDPEDPNLEEFKQVVKDFGKKAFGPRGGFPDDLTWCIRDGEQYVANKKKPPTGKIKDLMERSILIQAKSIYMPSAFLYKGGEFVEADGPADEKQFYTGMIAAMEGKLAAFEGEYPAIKFWFSQVAKLGKGEKIAGASANPKFGGMYDPDDDSVGAGQSSGGGDLDDEIPF